MISRFRRSVLAALLSSVTLAPMAQADPVPLEQLPGDPTLPIYAQTPELEPQPPLDPHAPVPAPHAVGGGEAAAQVADPIPDSPRPHAQVVVFGDSFTANGSLREGRPVDEARTKTKQSCVTDQNNWAKQFGRGIGKTVADWSCNGTAQHIFGYIAEAAAAGDLSPETEDVVIMFGGLDPLFYVDGAQNIALGSIPIGTYTQEVRLAVNAIRTHAPNAKITISNYPRMVSDQGNICVLGVPSPPIPGATFVESRINDVVRVGALASGANFVDMYAASQGHDTCSTPDQRWINIVPTPVSPGSMPSHPSDVGHDQMAQVMINAFAA